MIVGVTGRICSGTDTFAEMLVEYGFKYMSYSERLKKEAVSRRVDLNGRTSLQDFGDLLRKENGNGVLTKLLVADIVPGSNYVIGNLRNPGEVDELRKSKGSILVLIGASDNVRYKRLLDRKRAGDPDTLEGFIEMDKRDLGIGQPDNGQQHSKVFSMANYTIVNNSTEDSLRAEVISFLKTYKLI